MRVLAAFQSAAFLRSLLIAPPPSPNTELYSGSMVVSENTTLAPQISPRLSNVLPPLPDQSRRIYLLRHGETDWNYLGKIQGGGFDIALNENGRKQAMTVAEELDDIPIGVVASSHLSRAKETAEILLKRHPTTVENVVVDAGFAEMCFGELEGLASRDPNLDPEMKNRFSTITKQVKRDENFPFPGGGESTVQVEKRAKIALYNILEKHPEEKHISIVSHGRTNKVLIASVAIGDVRKFAEVRQSSKFFFHNVFAIFNSRVA